MQMIQSDDSVVLVWFFCVWIYVRAKKNISCICSKNVFFFSCISKPQKITFKSAIWVWTNVFKKSLSLWECRLSLAVFNQVKFRNGSSCCAVFSSRWNCDVLGLWAEWHRVWCVASFHTYCSDREHTGVSHWHIVSLILLEARCCYDM